MRGHAVILVAALAWLVGMERAEAKLDILVDKATQRMMVIQDGFIRYMWPVSTGRDNMATPNGVYSPQRLERNWFSAEYYSSPMPFSIFFHNGYAIHGSYAIDRLGGPASHGCVRLHPHHAAILFDLVQQEGPSNTTIEITDDGRPEGKALPEVAGGAGRDIAAGPPRAIAAGPARDIALVPPRDIPTGAGEIPPVPKIVRYRETGDVPPLSLAQHANRPIAAKSGLLPPPPAPPRPLHAPHRILATVRPPVSLPSAPSGMGVVDRANGAPPPPNESRPKAVEVAKANEGPKAAEGASAEPAQAAPSNASVKLLPTSCWSGGASRWKWWASSGQGNPCK
jgi:L,D-transpeptidase catalytic domain